MDFSLDHHTISLPLDERTSAIWTESGKCTSQARSLKASWALLVAKISDVQTTKFAILQQLEASPSNSSPKSASSLPRVETWAISENPDSLLRYAAEEQHTECPARVDATTGMIFRWDDKLNDGSMNVSRGPECIHRTKH